MKAARIYDVPTRVFHWTFVGLFLGAFIIAKTVDDESTLFPYHMIMGIALGAAVALRIIWGFVGTKYARFSSFELKPRALWDYFKNLASPAARRSAGHNPASSWAAVVMMGLALVLGVTGILMAQNINKETFEEVHEVAANVFVFVAIAHVLGLILHQFKHRDLLGFSMISGRKQAIDPALGIARTHRTTGVGFGIFMALFVFALNRHYDPGTGVLDFHGLTLQLGEADDGDTSSASTSAGDEDDDDDDEDDDD